jgi:hypothetical protein
MTVTPQKIQERPQIIYPQRDPNHHAHSMNRVEGEFKTKLGNVSENPIAFATKRRSDSGSEKISRGKKMQCVKTKMTSLRKNESNIGEIVNGRISLKSEIRVQVAQRRLF